MRYQATKTHGENFFKIYPFILETEQASTSGRAEENGTDLNIYFTLEEEP